MQPFGTGMFGGKHGVFSRHNYIQQVELTAIADFYTTVTTKEDVLPKHIELKERIDYLIEDFPQNFDELEPNEAKIVTDFLKFYFDLFDDRTKRAKIDDFIDAKLTFNVGNYHAERAKYYPAEYGKEIKKKGEWIMLLRVLPVQKQWQNEKYDIYYAVPTPSRMRLGEGIVVPYYKVQIVINGQEVCVWPHEYVPYNISEVLEGVGTQWVFHRLGGTPNYDVAKVHYLGTRGISKEQVYQMLMGAIQSLNYCYYSLVPEAHEYFDHVIDCLSKGIREEMIERIWLSKQTGKPLFNVIETTNDRAITDKGEDQPEDNSAADRSEG
jgi:hypothetical protein